MMPDGPGYAARSDVGLTRTGNEDRFLARPPLFAVADGMGGHQAGEVASELAIDLLAETADRSPAPDSDVVVETIERSNTAIRREAMLRSDLAGMGTTCTVMVIDEAVHIAHVGDSRAYRLRGEHLEQLTDDHSLVASMVREGIIDPADAMTDGRRNIITRALGAEDQVRVDVVTADLAPGDRLLLCSDGLHSQVDDEAIAETLRAGLDPGRTADRLVDLANAAGGDDNVTVIVIDVDAVVAAAPAGPGSKETAETEAIPTDAEDIEPAPAEAARRSVRWPLLFLLLVIVAVTLVVVGSWLTGSAPPA